LNYDEAMPRFALLLHETPPGHARGTHFDLLLEHGAVLRTWALAELPTVSQAVSAEQLPDHRPLYLDYEGEVAGGRGAVTRVDQGDYLVLHESAEQLVLHMVGSQLCGRLTIAREESPHRWRVSLVSG
jgi:DNA polymerase Ligase (LigD)